MDWEQVPFHPSRLAWAVPGERADGDIHAAYSADCICDGKPLRRPFFWRGAYWTNTGGGGPSGSWTVYRLTPRAEFAGEPTTYGDKVRVDGGERARRDPLGFYHGMAVASRGGTVVLTGPPVILFPSADASPEPEKKVEKKSSSGHFRLELKPRLFDNSTREKKNLFTDKETSRMTTINFSREGDIAKHAVFTATGATVVFDKKAGWEFTQPHFSATAKSFTLLNEELGKINSRLRFTGGGAGGKVLQLVAPETLGEAVEGVVPEEKTEAAEEAAPVVRCDVAQGGCGVEGHVVADCELKAAGDRELAREAERREAREHAKTVAAELRASFAAIGQPKGKRGRPKGSKNGRKAGQ